MAESIEENFSRISEHWRPKVVAELNGQEVKLVKFQGEFKVLGIRHEFSAIRGLRQIRSAR